MEYLRLSRWSHGKKILSGVVFSWLRFVVGFIVTLVQTPLYFKYLPKEVVGIWFLFFSAAAFLQMSDFGLPSAVSRAIAYIKNSNIKSNQPEVKFYTQFTVNDIYRSAFISFFIISAIVVIIGASLIIFFKPGFGVTQASSSEISLAFAIFIVGVFFNMTANIPNACLNGLGDVGYDNLFRIIVQSVGFVVIWIFLPIYSSIIVLSFIYLGQGIFSTCFVHLFLRFKHRKIFNLKSKFNSSLIKQLYKESIPLFINQIGGWLTNQSGIWIATIVLGASRIADYSVLVQLIFYGLSISMSIPAAINPYATAAFSAGGVDNTHKYFFLTLKTATFIVGIWIVIMAIWGKPIMDLWIGTGHFLGYGVLIPLLINCFLEMQHSIHGGFVWNTGKWPFVPATMAAGLLNLLFGFIGCHYWGFTGLAIGTMLAKLLTLNWYVVFYALRRLGLSIKEYVNEYLLKVFIIILFTIPFAYLISLGLVKYQLDFYFRGLPGNVFLSCFLGGIITLVVWSIVYYFFILHRAERRIISNILNTILHGRH